MSQCGAAGVVVKIDQQVSTEDRVEGGFIGEKRGIDQITGAELHRPGDDWVENVTGVGDSKIPIAKRAVSTPEGVVAINPPPRRGEGTPAQVDPQHSELVGTQSAIEQRHRDGVRFFARGAGNAQDPAHLGGFRGESIRDQGERLGVAEEPRLGDHDFFNERIKFGGVKIGDVRGEVARAQSAGIEARANGAVDQAGPERGRVQTDARAEQCLDRRRGHQPKPPDEPTNAASGPIPSN